MTEEEQAPQEEKHGRYLGVYDGMEFDEYKRAPGINNSGLKLLHKSPALYMDYKRFPPPDTQATKVGHAIHCAVYEPEMFDKLYIKARYEEFRSAEAKAWLKAAQEEGLTVLRTSNASEDPHRNPPEWDMVNYVADAVHAHPEASILVEDAVFERSAFWVDRKYKTYKLCKMRLDGYSPGHSMITDLKTAEDASMDGFMRAVNRYQYFRQPVFYSDGCRAEEVNLDVSNGFKFIVVEKQPPWHVEIYNLSKRWLEIGQAMILRDMDQFKMCHKFDVWPGSGAIVSEDPETPAGYRVHKEAVRDLPLPGYAEFQPAS